MRSDNAQRLRKQALIICPADGKRQRPQYGGDYTRAIEIDPKDANYCNGRAWAYFKAGKAAEGFPDAWKSLELRPDDANALNTRGHIFEALGERDEPIADYRSAISKNRDDNDSKDALKGLGVTP